MAAKLGMNLRELAYYNVHKWHLGYTDVAPDLDPLQRQHFSLVRFYATHNSLEPEDCANKVFATLQQLAARNLQAIVVLDDSLINSDCWVKSAANWHTGIDGHLIQDYWRGGKFETTYIPHVQRLLTTLNMLINAQPDADARKLRQTVYMFELGNEYSLHHVPHVLGEIDRPLRDNFLAFARKASGLIRQLWPNRRVHISPGIINTNQLVETTASTATRRTFAKSLYALPNITCVSIHWYSHFEQNERDFADIDIASTAKPCYVGEVGRIEELNDVPYLVDQINTWRTKNPIVILPWWYKVEMTNPLSHHEGELGVLASAVGGVFDAPVPAPAPTPATGDAVVRRAAADQADEPIAPFPVPIQGEYHITTRHGDPVSYTSDGKHHGYDLSARAGLPVLAATHGSVQRARLCDPCMKPGQPSFQTQHLTEAEITAAFNDPAWNWGFGHLVIIRYAWDVLPRVTQLAMQALGLANGYAFVFHAHLSSIAVENTTPIEAGTVLGKVGTTGNSTNNHLHLEVRVGMDANSWATRKTKQLDPMLMFTL